MQKAVDVVGAGAFTASLKCRPFSGGAAVVFAALEPTLDSREVFETFDHRLSAERVFRYDLNTSRRGFVRIQLTKRQENRDNQKQVLIINLTITHSNIIICTCSSRQIYS